MRILTTSQFAEALGVSTRTVERWLAAEKVKPAWRTPGRQARFTQAQVDALACPDRDVKLHGSNDGEAEPSTPSGTTPPPGNEEASAWARKKRAKRDVASLLS